MIDQQPAKAGCGSAPLCRTVAILLQEHDLVVRSVNMKQTKPILHNRFNGENTPVEHLDDSLGDMLVRKLIFPYAARQFDPRNTNDMGKRFDPRRAYANNGEAP